MDGISVPVAFAAGFISFVSPCVLPIVPAYVTYLAGSAAGAVGEGSDWRAPARRRMALNGLLFVLGFTLVFVAMGATAAGVGAWLRAYMPLLRRLGGAVIVLLGLHFAGLLRLFILEGERRLQPPPPDGSPWRALVLGGTFSAGWTPCIGPVLASVLTLAGTTASWQRGVVLLSAYAAGLAIPFLALALGLPRAEALLGRLRAGAPRIQLAGGLLLIGLGIMVYADAFTLLNSLFYWGF